MKRFLPLLGRLLLFLVLPVLLGLSFKLDSSTVTYTASDSRGSWQGVAPLENVTLQKTDNGFRVNAVLEPGAFDSGNFARDGNARLTVFDTGEFPTATLAGTVPLAAPLTGLEATGTATATFSGTLTLHGVTRDLTFPITVSRNGAQAEATGSFAVRLSDYDMTRPSLFGATVDDKVELDVSLTGTFVP